MLIGVEKGGAVDVTSEVFGTLPNGLSVAYANLHKASLSGNVLTLTFALNRTSTYSDGTLFDYIKPKYRPIQRVYMAYVNFGTKANSAIGYITPDGKVGLAFGNTSANDFYASVTYAI